MERIKKLGGFEKFIALVLIVMVVVFAVLYALITSRVGYAYKGSILTSTTENGNTVYSGEIEEKQACFTVSPDQIVTFTYGDTTYGPYTVKRDMTAIPAGSNCTDGVEIRAGGSVFFRGGFLKTADGLLVFDENGKQELNTYVSTSNEGVVGGVEPSAYHIIHLVEGPELTHKGTWSMWFLGLFLSVVVLAAILFADELFRRHVSFHVEDAELAQPTDWELSRRYLGWGLSAIMILVIFIWGLQ